MTAQEGAPGPGTPEQDAGAGAREPGAGAAEGRASTSGGTPKVQGELARAEAERIALQISARSLSTVRRSVGSPLLFAIVYTPLASAIYFSLGVISGHALGLTPLVFLIAAMLFALTAMTYAEGASLHQERSGSTVFARYAFNELISFAAGWAILLDYIILIAVTCYSASQYLKVFWSPLGHSAESLGLALVFILVVVLGNVRGFGWRRSRRLAMLVVGDLALQALIVVLGLVLFFNPHTLLDPIHLGSAPKWSDLVFALTIAAISFTSLESAAGLAGEVRIGGGALKRLVGTGTMTVLVVYVGIALVAVTALPVHDGHTELATRYLNDPVVGIVSHMHPHWLASTLRYVVGGLAALTLVAAANSAMLGLSRLAYSLSTNRQIPSGLGRLHPQRSTPYVLIILAGVIAAGLVVPENLDFLIGIYAFGALLAFTIAHVSVARMRFTDPDSRRPYRIPFSIKVGGASLPLPAVVGALLSGAGWVAVMILHDPARYVGLGWMLAGLAMYVIYRRADEAPLLRRVTVAPEVLRAEPTRERDYGSILVPLFGTRLDEDIVQTAALLVSGEPTDEAAIDAATIEAVWIFVIPMSLPLDARLPEAQIKEARQALARAKAVGEEYTGVQVATATVRTRRAGYAIVDEARRRGVEAIVLGAEEPSLIRGGARLGGRGGRLENFVGDVTKYVISKANCRVIVTAPAAGESAAEARSRLAPANP
ncbi:MAG: basic amino acid/polyamine antiporter, family [Solirubrobacteraceae bacterium]|jgi:APA family basic amino acid/polyamine antiporter|nr:basic amino acid/polyamine antiporter, family [Solirubrobacteraceae bacterium]